MNDGNAPSREPIALLIIGVLLVLIGVGLAVGCWMFRDEGLGFITLVADMRDPRNVGLVLLTFGVIFVLSLGAFLLWSLAAVLAVAALIGGLVLIFASCTQGKGDEPTVR